MTYALIDTRLTPEQRQKLEKLADKNNSSLNSTVKEIIEEIINGSNKK